MHSHQPPNLNSRAPPKLLCLSYVNCSLRTEDEDREGGRSTLSLAVGGGNRHFFFYIKVSQVHFQEEIHKKFKQCQCIHR